MGAGEGGGGGERGGGKEGGASTITSLWFLNKDKGESGIDPRIKKEKPAIFNRPL